MDQVVKKTVRDIRSLKIQGARNVASSAIKALASSVKSSRSRKAEKLLSEIESSASDLADSRPTEPMMRNLLDDALEYARMRLEEIADVKAFKKDFISREKGVLERISQDKKKVSEYGARLIPDNALIITHCHSSTVTGILVKAKETGKKFRVIVFETRPRYQGRITAKELAKAGIDTTISVDGGMNLHMKKADLVLVGADSIGSRGDLINKVGTSTLAHIARMHDVSFYSCAELLKYSSESMFGKREEIEQRDPAEVWEKPPKKVRISNPAFDVTSAKYISGYVTESGVIPTQSFFAMAREKLGTMTGDSNE
jgi:ribose 1,5-bisphosphate isomerase